MVVSLIFKLSVRDVDCAFKLYRARFFREHKVETRGAMINTEILYKFKRAGYTYTEVGVHHLPRLGGEATRWRGIVVPVGALSQHVVGVAVGQRREQLRARERVRQWDGVFGGGTGDRRALRTSRALGHAVRTRATTSRLTVGAAASLGCCRSQRKKGAPLGAPLSLLHHRSPLTRTH